LGGSEVTEQALRFNSDKPESDYIFTYVGGVDLIFHEDFPYYPTVKEFGCWYRDECDIRTVLHQFRADVDTVQVMQALVDTNTRGAKKYAVGNYLKGANFRQYAQSFVRHMHCLQAGIEVDGEGYSHLGNASFNLLMLDHCIQTGIGIDDRIRK
jgi:hypothetical protein